MLEDLKRNPKQLHAYMRHKKVGCLTVGPLELGDGRLTDGALLMAETLATAFESVYVESWTLLQHLRLLNTRVQLVECPPPPLDLTFEDVIHTLQSLDHSSAAGLDNWPVARRGNLSFFENPQFSRISGLCHLKTIDWLHIKIYIQTSFPKAVNKTCPCGVTIFTSHHKVITSSRLLQGYCIKVYQSYYVTVTLTNHRPFQNRPALVAKKCIFAHRRVVRVGYSKSSRWKLSL